MKKIGKNVFFGKNVKIQDFVLIGIPSDKKRLLTKIGKNSKIRSHTIIYSGNIIGDNFQTGHHVLIREENKIGDNVSIGSFSDLEHHVLIEDDVRIHSKVFIPEYSILRKGCWIGPGVTITNAKYPKTERTKELLDGVVIEKNVKIGAGSLLMPGVRIGENSLIGAGSLVTKDIPKNSVAIGNPAKVIKTIDKLKYEDTKKQVYNDSVE
jgi:acetyltransferase-like isoleucine patch superfamily enzyme